MKSYVEIKSAKDSSLKQLNVVSLLAYGDKSKYNHMKITMSSIQLPQQILSFKTWRPYYVIQQSMWHGDGSANSGDSDREKFQNPHMGPSWMSESPHSPWPILL